MRLSQRSRAITSGGAPWPHDSRRAEPPCPTASNALPDTDATAAEAAHAATGRRQRHPPGRVDFLPAAKRPGGTLAAWPSSSLASCAAYRVVHAFSRPVQSHPRPAARRVVVVWKELAVVRHGSRARRAAHNAHGSVPEDRATSLERLVAPRTARREARRQPQPAIKQGQRPGAERVICASSPSHGSTDPEVARRGARRVQTPHVWHT